MSLVGNKRVTAARRPSPSKDDTGAEQTFQQKLEEIKRLRMSNKPEECVISNPHPLSTEDATSKVVPKTVKTINGYKTFLKSFGDWVEVVSKSGKVYYYNKRSLVNQWKKPEEWLKEEERLNMNVSDIPIPELPPLPPEPDHQQPNQPPPPALEDDNKLRLKLLSIKKIQKRLKNPEAHLPLAYQKNQKRLDESDSDNDEETKKPKLTVENAFEDPEENASEAINQKLAKLDPEDEIGHMKPEPIVEEGKNANAKDENVESIPSDCDQAAIKKDPKDCRHFDPRISGPARAENLIEGCAAQLAFKNLTSTNNSQSDVPDPSFSTPVPGNPTYFMEYNLPCCLRRCKFPKEQVHFEFLKHLYYQTELYTTKETKRIDI